MRHWNLHVNIHGCKYLLFIDECYEYDPDYSVQGSPKECFPGLVNFVTAVAYHFCLNLPRAFSQPGKHSFGDPCTYEADSTGNLQSIVVKDSQQIWPLAFQTKMQPYEKQAIRKAWKVNTVRYEILGLVFFWLRFLCLWFRTGTKGKQAARRNIMSYAKNVR